MPTLRQKRRREQRQAEKEALAELESEQGRYKPVDRDLAHEKIIHSMLNNDGTLRKELRFWRHQGRTTEFVYIIQRKIKIEWLNVARIDCSHGSCHLHHPDDADPGEIIARLDTVNDVERAAKPAEDRLATLAESIMESE